MRFGLGEVSAVSVASDRACNRQSQNSLSIPSRELQIRHAEAAGFQLKPAPCAGRYLMLRVAASSRASQGTVNILGSSLSCRRTFSATQVMAAVHDWSRCQQTGDYGVAASRRRGRGRVVPQQTSHRKSFVWPTGSIELVVVTQGQEGRKVPKPKRLMHCG